jgi:hypothetical protein
MGATSSALIDELHTASTLPDAVARKVKVLRAVQEHARSAEVSIQLVEQNGLQPLTRCYNAPHPTVRIEAAKALAVVARQPANQLDMGLDDVLPHLVLPLLTGDAELKEHAMATLALISRPEQNKMKLVHEGLLGTIIEEISSRQVPLQRAAISALEQIMQVPQVSVLAAQRGAMFQLLKAARSDDDAVKIATLRAMVSLASAPENVGLFVSSGCTIFLVGCTYCSAEMQLEVARCLEKLLGGIFEGQHLLSSRDAKVFSALAGVAIPAERITEGGAMEFDVKQASNMSMVELLPELVDRTKRLINCDRASIFLLSEDGGELTTILAQNTQQISIPADNNSIAGVVRSRHPPSHPRVPKTHGRCPASTHFVVRARRR